MFKKILVIIFLATALLSTAVTADVEEGIDVLQKRLKRCAEINFADFTITL